MKTQKETTHIIVSLKLWAALRKLKNKPGDSFESIIWDLLKKENKK